MGESVAALLAHALYLADFSDSLLELFHPVDMLAKWKKYRWEGCVPWSVILDVVFLDFLDVVVGLRIVHAFSTISR